MECFSAYVESLTGSWRALTMPHRSAIVAFGEGFVACRHPSAVLNNALVLEAKAVGPARQVFDDDAPFALWCRDDDEETCAVLDAGGFRRDVTTRAMRCDLENVTAASSAGVLVDADVARIAELNGLPGEVLMGVPEIRGYATQGLEAGLVIIGVGSDANVSFVATRPNARRRGLASALTAAALVDARERGAATATLQATPLAEHLYTKLGFEPVARIQEWLPQA